MSELHDVMSRTIQRNSLKYSVGSAISCPGCGNIMDCRRAVECSIRDADAGSYVFVKTVCTSCYDSKLADYLPKLVTDKRLSLEILDGRKLFGRRK